MENFSAVVSLSYSNNLTHFCKILWSFIFLELNFYREHLPKACLVPCQTCAIELLAKIVNVFYTFANHYQRRIAYPVKHPSKMERFAKIVNG